MILRPGTPADIPALDAIARAAKAHWGYAGAQLDAWHADLSVAPASLPADPLCVAEEGGQPVAFVQVGTGTRPWEIAALWVRLGHMGRGIGKALLAWARQHAAAAGQQELAIDADPHAAGFYQACGAVAVGSVPAPIAGQPGRARPQLRLRTRAA